MSHGGHGDKEPLPEVVYSIVDPSALIPSSVGDRQAEAYGFNRGGTAWDDSILNDSDGRYLRWLRKCTFRSDWFKKDELFVVCEVRRVNLCWMRRILATM